MNFNTICNLHQTDKGNLKPYGNDYANFYDNWFSQTKIEVKNICEIGIDNGGSLKSYYDYFPNAYIIGLDINDKSQYQNDRISTKIVDQSNITDLKKFVSFCLNNDILFDFILDDGSHDVQHQQLTFGYFFKLIKPGGLYIIEDLGSSYFKENVFLYGYQTTKEKKDNNTINFLNNRPFQSPWITTDNLQYINQNINYVSIFDKLNTELPYSKEFECDNEYPIRSITSVIKKK